MARYKIQKQYIFSNKPYNQISEFLKQYPNINLQQVRDQKQNTALHQAAYNSEDIRILKKYLQYMEKYCEEKDKSDPQNSFREFVNFKNQDGLTALHFAAYKGNYKAIELLCNNGADYTKRTASGQNVLHMAAQGGMVEAFIYFESLIDINEQDSKQSTALHWAAYMNNQSIATFLLARPGIRINAQDIKKQTPLHLAASYGHTKIVKKLLRAGADRKLKNLNGQTAIKIARDNEFRNIQKLLNDEHSCLDYFKLYLNLKSQYKPEKRSIVKPIIYMASLMAVLFLRIFLFKQVEGKGYVKYVQYGLYGILLIFYISLLSPPKKVLPKKYIDFLNGNVNIKKVCLTCAQIKPIRSQHCDICRKCIQRYDHHCYWVNNCIGKRNIGRFVTFILLFQIYLFYAVGLSTIILINCLSNTNIILEKRQQSYNIYCVSYAFAVGLFSLGFSFPMLGLIVVHIKNLLLNKTTFERFTKDKISNLTESRSHLLEDEINPQKVKKYSISNVRAMCRDDDEASQSENINSSLVSEK